MLALLDNGFVVVVVFLKKLQGQSWLNFCLKSTPSEGAGWPGNLGKGADISRCRLDVVVPIFMQEKSFASNLKSSGCSHVGLLPINTG